MSASTRCWPGQAERMEARMAEIRAAGPPSAKGLPAADAGREEQQIRRLRGPAESGLDPEFRRGVPAAHRHEVMDTTNGIAEVSRG